MTVYLVGAGPGDPGLITAARARAGAPAEVLVYDRLAAPRAAREAPAGLPCSSTPARRPADHAMTQDEINACLVEHGAHRPAGWCGSRAATRSCSAAAARRRRRCAAPASPYEVVPGITSAIAVPAYAGIPVTHRGLATHFTVVTGHEDPTKGRTTIDWEALAQAGGTLVILMGVGRLPEIAQRLIGRRARRRTTPAAVIERGTTAAQRTSAARWRRSPRDARRSAAAGDHGRRPGGGDARRDRMGGAPAPARRHGGRDPRPRAGPRPRAAAARPWGGGLEAPVIRIEPIAGPPIDPRTTTSSA